MPNTKPDKPLNRKEQYLNRISGDNTQELPSEDLNREEQYLRAIVDHVGAIEEATDGIGERITTLQSEVSTATETAEAAKAAADEAKEEASKTGINLLIGTNRGAEGWSSNDFGISTEGEAVAGDNSLSYKWLKATCRSSTNHISSGVLRYAMPIALTKLTLPSYTLQYTPKLTLSFEIRQEIKTDIDQSNIIAAISAQDPVQFPNAALTDAVRSKPYSCGSGEYAKWQKLAIVLTRNSKSISDLTPLYLFLNVTRTNQGTKIYIRNLSLVEGEGGYRDWQPSPYEVPELATQIDAVDVDVSGIHDSIQGIDDSISSLEQSVADIQTETAGIGKITENGANIVSNLVENWEQGTVDKTLTGDPYDVSKIDSDTRIRVVKPFRTNHPFTVSVSNPDYEFTVLAYNDADLFQMNLTDDYVPGKKYFDTDYAKIAIIVKRADDAPAITPENILDVGLKVQLGNVDLPIYTPPTVDINANAEAIAKLQQRTVYPPDIYRGDSFGGQIVNITGDAAIQDAKTAIIEFGEYRMVCYPDSGLVSVTVELVNWSFCNYTSTELEQLSFTIPQAIFKPDGDMTVLMPGGIAMLIQPSGNATFYCPWIPTQDSTVSNRVDAYGTGYFTFTYLRGDGAGGG